MPNQPQILIVDFGSQYTLLIARALRELEFRSVVLSPSKVDAWLKTNTPKAVILSGSDRSVYDTDAPAPSASLLALQVPTLGICYGMQWMAQHLGGKVKRDHDNVEYGPTAIKVVENDPLLQGLKQVEWVWASHGDSVTELPDTATITARSEHGISAIRSIEHSFWGVQFHPEVADTHCGKMLLLNFVQSICGCTQDWNPQDIVTNIRHELSDPAIRAIIGFSGGVDSTTMAAVLAPTLRDRLLAVCIDGGNLRKGELDQVREHAAAAGVMLKVIDMKDRFMTALAGVTDAEEKRWHFKQIYLQALKKEIQKFRATHIVQGTLATDLIESGATGGANIKSHHNVGLDFGNTLPLQPLSAFFKYEVRSLAEELGLPRSVTEREPFPGPGLFIRVVGTVANSENLELVRFADAEVRRILEQFKVSPVSQLVVALAGLYTVGIKGDARTYGPSILIRAVRTTDFMTAEAVRFPDEVRTAITKTLTKHSSIVRVWFDETPKPPATTEFE